MVEAGSFSKAADKLYISPPAVIKQINSLENNLGVQLFARTHRGLVVTAAGESLYQDAKYMVNYSKYEITPVEPYTSDDLNWTNSSSRYPESMMMRAFGYCTDRDYSRRLGFL